MEHCGPEDIYSSVSLIAGGLNRALLTSHYVSQGCNPELKGLVRLMTPWLAKHGGV